MKKHLTLILSCITAAVFCSGCMESSTTITVNKDATGTITQEILFNANVLPMLMGNMMGGQPQGDMGGAMQIPIEPDKYKAKAPKLGEDVTFIKAEQITSGGKSGVRVTYEFKDVRKLSVNESPDMPGDMGGMAMGGASSKANPIKFDFKEGASPKLIVHMPKPKDTKMPTAVEPGDMPDMPDMGAQEMAMMKKMFDGFRIRVLIKVNGEIKKTNASHVSKDASGKKNVVTIMDMDMGKLMADEKYMHKLKEMGATKDMAKAKELLKDVPGLKFETEEFIEVAF